MCGRVSGHRVCKCAALIFNVAVFWFLVTHAGFGGRGVLPGVATGTDLNPKSSKVQFSYLTLNVFHRRMQVCFFIRLCSLVLKYKITSHCWTTLVLGLFSF